MTARSAGSRLVLVVVGAVAALLAAASAASGAAWPGAAGVSEADDANVFGQNLSGLAYQASGSSAPGVLWAVQNSPSVLFRIVNDGTKWKPDPTNGWSVGKSLRYTDDLGAPDAEGVTLAGGDANGIYVATERDGGGGSRPAVLRYDVSSLDAHLTATNDWNLTPDLPGLGANLGLEAIAWVPDSVLVAKGLADESKSGAAYDPASYPDHGSGLFFVGVEQNGLVIAYALNSQTNGFTRIASFASGFPQIMELEFEPDTGLLWAVCDNNCHGQTATLDIAQSGADDGKYVVTNTYDRPGGMPDLNNEGFAFAPRAECASDLRPVFWSDDSNTNSHALRTGKVRCADLTPPPAPDADGDGVPDSSDACPSVSDAAAQRNPRTGCPADAAPPADSDGDGVPDSTDQCPGVAAATANGCPVSTGPTPTNGNDVLNGTAAGETICGLLGNDVIHGLGGNDILFGDLCGVKARVRAARAGAGGNDTLHGDAGNDVLYGAGGADKLFGDAGKDKLFGGDGNDKLTGGKGANTIKGGAGNDSVKARNGKKDKIDCGSGKKDSATVDKRDKVKGCERVKRAKH